MEMSEVFRLCFAEKATAVERCGSSPESQANTSESKYLTLRPRRTNRWAGSPNSIPVTLLLRAVEGAAGINDGIHYTGLKRKCIAQQHALITLAL